MNANRIENAENPARAGLGALHVAAGRGDVDAVRRLLAEGADPSPLAGAAGMTPLHLAAQAGSVPVVGVLLEAGAFLNLQAPTGGVTALMTAVWFRHPDVVEFLLDRPEVNVELRAVFGATAADLIGFGQGPDDPGMEAENAVLREMFTRHRQRRDRIEERRPLIAALTDPVLARRPRRRGPARPADDRPRHRGRRRGVPDRLFRARRAHRAAHRGPRR